MKTKTTFNAKKYHSEIVAWMKRGNNRQTMLNDRVSELETLVALSDHDLNLMHQFATQSLFLATWPKHEFLDQIYRCADGLLAGSRMLDYIYLGHRIAIAISDTPWWGGRRHTNQNLYLLFLLLTSFRRWEQASWLGRRLYLGNEEHARRPDDDKDNGIQPWENRPLGGLVLRLYLVMSGQMAPDATAPVGIPDAGAYAGLFSNWHNPAALGQSIQEACDYHVLRTKENPKIRYDVAEFDMEPYNVLPVEILSLRAVRAHLGLKTPFPSHPLLDSPFVTNLPLELPACTDDLLLDVIAATDKVLPGFLSDNPQHIQPGVVKIPAPPPKPVVPTPPHGLVRTETLRPAILGPQVLLLNCLYHVHGPEEAHHCGAELFAQMVREHAENQHRVWNLYIGVTGAPNDMLAAYHAFQEASARNPEVEQWLLGELPRFEMNFETPDGAIVRNYEYWTEDGERRRMEMKPAED